MASGLSSTRIEASGGPAPTKANSRKEVTLSVDKPAINFYDIDIIHDTKGVHMNKGDLIEALKRKNGFTREKAERVIDLFFGEMSNGLANGHRVGIRGFGSIFVKNIYIISIY